MPHYSLGDLARAIDAEAEGDLGLRLNGLAEPQSCRPDQLAIAMDPKYIPALARGQARAAILPAGTDWQALGLEGAVFVTRPRLSMSRVTAAFKEHTLSGAGPAIHGTAVIGADVTLGEGVRIGALAVIDDGAVIGAGSQIGPQVWIGHGVTIGKDAELAAGTRIMPGTRVGDRLFTHPGVVIGSDGFSFVTLEKSAVESVRETLQDAAPDIEGQAWLKIESLGGVRIGDDVEIGANSIVDAGTIRPTAIGSGTKIDALAQIAHNVQIGRNCLICGHSGVAGSTVIGDNCVLGGMTGVADNVVIGDGVIAAGGSKIVSNVPPGRAVFGYPAVKMDTHIETYRALRRLPRALARLAKLEKALAAGDERD